MDSKEQKKWKVLSTKVITDNPWFPIRADTVEVANGKVMEDFYVISPTDWSFVIALTPDNDIVLVRQYRHGIRKSILEFPGGMVDAEDGDIAILAALEGAKRELVEETGYYSDDVIHLGSISGNPVRYTNQAHFFLAQNAVKTSEQALDEMEDIEVVLMPFKEFVTMALESKIEHPHDLAGLLLALNHLGKIHV